MLIETLRYLAARVSTEERGATAVEYGLMVALIAVIIIGAVTALGQNVNEAFNEVACRVGGGTWTDGSPGTCT